MKAVITAGGTVSGDFAVTIGTPIKALAPLGGGQRLIDRAIEAARALGIEAIAVVGEPDVAAHCGDRVDRVIPAVADGSANMQAAFAAFPGDDLLYLTSDLPFIDEASLRDFVTRSADAEITMPLANATAYESRFPGASAHTVALGGDRVANGSVFFIRGSVVPSVAAAANRFFESRKSLFAMATLLGPKLLAAYLFRRLTIEMIEAKASRELGGRARAIHNAGPELCYDVDTLAEYDYARSALAR